ncbi:MAG: STAS domain-containing protein [Actinomycetota bacterium]|nr:STAS domain-containing protein [Actinomycetota bacterium]MDD5666659.1 STAS domain-containing protein [Actinomycetota bacterium]
MDNNEREGAELDVVLESVGNFSLIGLSGEVDVYSAPKLRETIKDLVDEGKYNIVVDLERVAFLDSTGLGVLVGGLKRVKHHSGELGIICGQEKILRIFRITGLTKVFPVYHSRDELLAQAEEA